MINVYIGRVVFGLGIGTAMHVAPLYIAEISPNDLRGRLISIINIDIVIRYIIDLFVIKMISY